MALRNSISNAEARRIALHAQQFGTGKAPPRTAAAFGGIVARLGAVQIDSVNVLVRSHYLPTLSRFGAYTPAVLDRSAYEQGRRRLFEYWGHEASFMPLEMFPLFRWRMERAQRGEGTWGRLRRYATEHQALVDAALAQIRERGALGAGDLVGGGKSTGGWWGWSQGKEIMEWLFWTGVVTTASRRNFERLYDLSERVIPPTVFATSIDKATAQRELLRRAALALGVATLADLRDYFRLPTADTPPRIQELLDAGELRQVTVAGWKQQAYMHTQARCPAQVPVDALLSPFDSLIWERQRTERLFGFRYRLEIYTPAHKRVHGYYVLPYLWNERLVARLDLKADRASGRLQVKAATLEDDASARRIAPALSERLLEMALWLGLAEVELISRRGDLMRELRRVRGRR